MPNTKIDKLIPVDEKKVRFAYQQEGAEVVLTIVGNQPSTAGSEEYPNAEKEQLRKYHCYELTIFRHTSNQLTVDFKKFFEDGRIECYQTGFSFSGLVNAIFKDQECTTYVEKEGKRLIWQQIDNNQVWHGKFKGVQLFEISQIEDAYFAIRTMEDKTIKMPSLFVAKYYCETELLEKYIQDNETKKSNTFRFS